MTERVLNVTPLKMQDMIAQAIRGAYLEGNAVNSDALAGALYNVGIRLTVLEKDMDAPGLF